MLDTKPSEWTIYFTLKMNGVNGGEKNQRE